MSELIMASLAALDRAAAEHGRAVVSDKKPIDVQFNPSSLRMQYQNNQDKGGLTTGTQVRQHPSARSATLSFDLEFDTAEETNGTEPVDVRDRTAQVRRFVEPPVGGKGPPPPPVQFKWGRLTFNGLVTQVTEELDYFALDGTPLRAKLSLTITEQNLKYAAAQAGQGARDDHTATAPGGEANRSGTGAAPGRSGAKEVTRLLPAVDLESAQQLAARAGGDPRAWRSMMNDLPGPLAIPAGTPVAIGPELAGGLPIGRAMGFASGAGDSTEDGLANVLGLVAPTAGVVRAGSFTADAAGFALSAAGGVVAATAVVLSDSTAHAVDAARAAFAVPARDLAGDSGLDPRSLTYGGSIPLRAKVDTTTAADIESGGRRSLGARARPHENPLAGSPRTAPWDQLPPETSKRLSADQAQRGRDARASTLRWKPGGECR
ncbi:MULTISPECIES: hypothetical protein [Kribbella]|uniref:CIS tube protein n=1 Tax=Kribbella TaxID=182639 RepID=UPI001053E881|nr:MULTISPECIES: hypothetical protein [Kribbella]